MFENCYEPNGRNRELYDACVEACEFYKFGKNNCSPNAIYNALQRAGIRNLDDLKNASEKGIARTRDIGYGKKFAIIMSMKIKMEEEES